MAVLLAVGVASVAVIDQVTAPATDRLAAPVSDPQEPLLVARRLISIPFGIDASLPIVEYGNAVVASGHGTCTEGGSWYRLRVDVVQASTGARAMGSTEGDCLGGSALMWEALAVTPPPFAFEAGPAEVCAMVQVFPDHGSVVVGKWCADVTVQ